MNIDIAYKGLKYLVAWGLFYFVIKYTLNDQFTDIDIILIAVILTLLLCIGEYVVYNNNSNGNNNRCKYEHMDGPGFLPGGQNNNQNQLPVQSTIQSTVQSTTHSLAQNSTPVISANNTSDIQSIDSSQSSSIQSPSDQSSSSLMSQVDSTKSTDSGSSNSTPSVISNNLIYNKNEIGIKDIDYIPPIASQPLNYSVSVTQDPKYTVHDYMGNDVKLDINAFGGTAIKQNNNDNIYPNPNPMTIDSTGSSKLYTGIVAAQNDIITKKPLSIDQTIKDIKINLPINGSGQQFIRLDNVASSTIDNSLNSDGTTTMHTQRHAQDGRPLRWYEQAFNPRSYEGAENLDQIAVSGGRTRNDILVNEMIYSDFNRMPPSFVEKDFEYGYSFLPPKDWYPLPPYPPVCSSNRTCLVQPIYTDSTTMDLKDWHETQKIGPPDSLNTSFITNELNSKI